MLHAFHDPLPPVSSPPPPPLVRNAALYALGKVLIQLVENRPLVGGSGHDVGTAADPAMDPELEPAVQLERTIARKAGVTWAQVIRRCLYCEFDTDTAGASLSNDDFLRKVYAGVVAPLAEALKNLGEPLRTF